MKNTASCSSKRCCISSKEYAPHHPAMMLASMRRRGSGCTNAASLKRCRAELFNDTDEELSFQINSERRVLRHKIMSQLIAIVSPKDRTSMKIVVSLALMIEQRLYSNAHQGSTSLSLSTYAKDDHALKAYINALCKRLYSRQLSRTKQSMKVDKVEVIAV
eukprot:CAMPEP_0116029946 /NCGR_PEP_ID=MMETSP0321-20121206/16510_1 /TAXON_ID=163516 /ORGANISM="Leptocylindrus danicus var. danicus, Strain B650" /LENGTH=160 /DNA_ID=CAMNT_0003504555 /DNA_START=201 /DNA_END=683 /DNA_ORIENTATION=-